MFVGPNPRIVLRNTRWKWLWTWALKGSDGEPVSVGLKYGRRGEPEPWRHWWGTEPQFLSGAVTVNLSLSRHWRWTEPQFLLIFSFFFSFFWLFFFFLAFLFDFWFFFYFFLGEGKPHIGGSFSGHLMPRSTTELDTFFWCVLIFDFFFNDPRTGQC